MSLAVMPEVTGLDVAEVGKYGPYRPEAYNSLPTLSVAGTAYETQDAEKLLFGPMRQLFLDHNVQDTYGVVLLHNHFDIDPEDRLVERRGISVLWSFGDVIQNTTH
ncbi:unnamed protein product [Clonostachys rosea f. rosea IK726]|uniref:Uncharacterized protein n=1 Tax=Clonostachys rosea f. rosea IK726 TaxID=1349383 RepID=A0ACA9U1K3_BIOOC|nr:unnamed protein product [Clonostachys rosea f. rosea IK726]